MIFIYLLIISIILINDIQTTNISNNSSFNRLLIISTCQTDQIELKTIRKSSDRRYYFYFTNQSSSSLSTASFFLPSLHLSYCDYQDNTYYSSSGFSILRSSPRLHLTDILDKEHSLSFHHHNAILSVVDQSSTPSSNMITTVMSSSSSSKESHALIGNEDNLIVATINSLATTTATFSNSSIVHTSLMTTTQQGNRTFNIMLLVGCVIGGILFLITIYTIMKYCNRDEGSYRIDESKNFTTQPQSVKIDKRGCSGKTSSSKHHRQKLLTTNEPNLPISKEWYV